MGLDAYVFCNCFELGLLRELPPVRAQVYVADNGSLECVSTDLSVEMAFDQWLNDRACQHPRGCLVHHYIGNISLVALLRSELSRDRSKFPTILNKVIYNGIHGGDYIPSDEVAKLKIEIQELKNFHSRDTKTESFIRDFEMQLSELVEAALKLNKPISF